MPTHLEHSTFASLHDTFPHRATSTWPDDFLEWMDVRSSQEKNKAPLWSPALYHEGAVRKKGATTNGIESVTALVLDYDWKPESDRAVTVEQARSVWSEFEYVLHTTASHTPDAHQFRVVLPYSRPLTPAEHTWLWEKWALKYTSDRGALPDPISEPSRMFFIPTRRVDFEQGAISEHHTGDSLDVDFIFSKVIGAPPVSTAPAFDAEFTQASTPGEKASAEIITALLEKTAGQRVKQPMFAGIDRSHESEDLELIESKCAFMKHARDNAAKLPEPEWFAWLSIVGRCKDGRKTAHEIGSAHGGYSYDETEDKLKRALNESGPRGCDNIRKLSNACKDCPLGKPVGDVTSPVQLGRPERPEPSPNGTASASGEGGDTVEDAAATCARLEKALERLRAEHAEAQLSEAKAKETLKYRQKIAKLSAAEVDPASEEAAKEYIASKQRVKRLAEKVRDVDGSLKAAKKKTQILDKLSEGSDKATVDKLLMSEKGPKSVLANVLTIIETDPLYAGKIKYNLFAEDIQLVHEGSTRSATDHLDTEINGDIQRRYTVDVSTNILREAMLSVAHKNEFNPVADYLRGLVWDGVSRLEHLMRRGFGAAGNITGKVAATGAVSSEEASDIKYLAEAGTKLCIGAVARVLSVAGCKVDTVVVLYGAQGRKKSTGLKALAGAQWFDDSLMRDIGDKDSIMQLQGTWFYELSELDSVKKAETTKVKAFISSTTDKFRPPYGHHMQRRHRQTILVGSTNEEQFLADASGSRRFIPIEVRQVDAEWISANRDQLWAEAVVRFDRGESYWYDMTEMTLLATSSERFQQTDAWDSLVLNYILDNKKTAVTMAEILTVCLMLPVGQINRAQEMRVAKILKGLDCSRKQRRAGGKLEWFYTIPPSVFTPDAEPSLGAQRSTVPGMNAPPTA
jgi:predicted P-loop ATPase